MSFSRPPNESTLMSIQSGWIINFQNFRPDLEKIIQSVEKNLQLIINWSPLD